MRELRTAFRYFDWWLLISTLVLIIVGLIAVYSSSTYTIGDEVHRSNECIKQLMWAVISIIVGFAIIRLPVPLFELLIVPGYILSVLLLIVSFAMPQVKGASRWIIIGPFTLQPAEFVKISTILLLGKVLGKQYLSDFQIITRSLLITLPSIVLLILQPDLGSAFILGVIMLGIVIFSDLPKHYIILAISPFLTVVTTFKIPLFILYMIVLIFVLYRINLSWIVTGFTVVINLFVFFLVPFIWNYLKDYQKSRILTFLDPTKDPLGAGYQAIQSRIAIGSGQFQGKGFLLGTQKNLNFLPERHTDLIFSVIAEEFGFIGASLLILLFLFFISRLVISLKSITVREQRLSIVGFLFLFTSQAAVNIAINLGIFPTTGLPLPFISYGGSSMLASVIAVSVVMKYMTQKSFIH
ncbi:MAG: FtsW/RodA/SpoVE family cell cycle protein [Candidatus Cloacimonadia bacterium]